MVTMQGGVLGAVAASSALHQSAHALIHSGAAACGHQAG